MLTTSRSEERPTPAGTTSASSPRDTRSPYAWANGTTIWRASAPLRPSSAASACGATTASDPTDELSGSGTDTSPDASASPHESKRGPAAPPTSRSGVRATLGDTMRSPDAPPR